jgi:hypothetical protein
MHAAVQQIRGTITPLSVPLPVPERRQLRRVELPIGLVPFVPTPQRMTPPKPREFFIQGITAAGRQFRPSDWAERLAGALSSFRPKGAGIGAHIGYSPYCIPRVIDNVKCVIVNEALRDLEPMAWDFVMNFARDNELQVVEACLLPEPGGADAA